MYFSMKRLFWITFFGIFGFAVSISILILNKLIGYNISALSSGTSSDFSTTIFYIISNRLNNEDLLIAFFGFLLTALLVTLSSRRYY